MLLLAGCSPRGTCDAFLGSSGLHIYLPDRRADFALRLEGAADATIECVGGALALDSVASGPYDLFCEPGQADVITSGRFSGDLTMWLDDEPPVTTSPRYRSAGRDECGNSYNSAIVDLANL